MDEIVSNSDTELTSAAMSTAAVSAAAAAAAAADGGGDWQMCDVETRILPSEWYDYVSSQLLDVMLFAIYSLLTVLKYEADIPYSVIVQC